MYRIRNLLVILLAFTFFLPLTSAEDNTYRVEGLPDDLHFETGKAYTVVLTASNYSAIANVNISVTNGSLSETEDFGDNVLSLNLAASEGGWTFYWQAPSETFNLGEGNAVLSVIFEDSEGSTWSSYESVMRPPEVHAHAEPAVPDWAMSMAWTGASITVIVTVVGALVLRRDSLK